MLFPEIIMAFLGRIFEAEMERNRTAESCVDLLVLEKNLEGVERVTLAVLDRDAAKIHDAIDTFQMQVPRAKAFEKSWRLGTGGCSVAFRTWSRRELARLGTATKAKNCVASWATSNA